MDPLLDLSTCLEGDNKNKAAMRQAQKAESTPVTNLGETSQTFVTSQRAFTDSPQTQIIGKKRNMSEAYFA